jgi:hypothetical protein
MTLQAFAIVICFGLGGARASDKGSDGSSSSSV